jgi:hypothetical protein
MMAIFDVCDKRAPVRINLVKFLLVSLAISATARGQMPASFQWVDLRHDAAAVQKVEQALKAEDYTAIREIGVADGFALAMVVRRESGQDVPEGDQWLVYNVSMKSGKVQALLTGSSLQIKRWIGFYSREQQDLGIVYLDCWECEPASLFTAFHCDSRDGWRARWTNKEDPNHPGITFRLTDVGKPFTNEDDADQVFAVLEPKDGVASVGTWYHSRDLATGKVSDGVSRSSVDPSTGKDRSADLTGSEAKELELQLCKTTDSSWGLAIGQSSHACKGILSVKRKASK